MGVVNIARCKISSNDMSGEQETMYGGVGLVMEANKGTFQSMVNSTFSHSNATTSVMVVGCVAAVTIQDMVWLLTLLSTSVQNVLGIVELSLCLHV